MVSKEKKIIGIFILICLVIIGLILLQKQEKITYAYDWKSKETASLPSLSTIENVSISTAKKIDVDEIIQKNSASLGYREEISVQEEELEYITKYRNNDELYIGTTQ